MVAGTWDMARQQTRDWTNRQFSVFVNRQQTIAISFAPQDFSDSAVRF
jgi:hypothetical protein